IVRQSSTGHATNIIAGLAVGMKSTVIPIITLASGIVASYYFAGLYGVAIAAARSEEHTSELQSRSDLVCRLLLEKKKKKENSLQQKKKKKLNKIIKINQI